MQVSLPVRTSDQTWAGYCTFHSCSVRMHMRLAHGQEFIGQQGSIRQRALSFAVFCFYLSFDHRTDGCTSCCSWRERWRGEDARWFHRQTPCERQNTPPPIQQWALVNANIHDTVPTKILSYCRCPYTGNPIEIFWSGNDEERRQDKANNIYMFVTFVDLLQLSSRFSW